MSIFCALLSLQLMLDLPHRVRKGVKINPVAWEPHAGCPAGLEPSTGTRIRNNKNNYFQIKIRGGGKCAPRENTGLQHLD